MTALFKVNYTMRIVKQHSNSSAESDQMWRPT